MNTKGSGVTYYKDSHSDEMKLYNGGLKAMASGQKTLEHGKRIPRNFHDLIDYQRGTILHSRAPHNKRFLFHYLYGGGYKYYVQRWMYQSVYKRYLRYVWVPMMGLYIFQCIGMRMYDNRAYDYYYFSD